MTPVETFLVAIDRLWARPTGEKLRLRIIGSMALMLQAEYLRGTKDGDILESADLDPGTRGELLALAGKGTPLAEMHGMFLDIVPRGILLLPPAPRFHPVPELNARLDRFEIEALDIVDVLISKLKPYRSTDAADIEAMARLGLIDPDRFRERFLAALDRFVDGASGAEKFHTIVARFHQVQREQLLVEETWIEPPGWVDEE